MSNYWEKRAETRMYEAMELAENASSELSKIYLKSSGYLSKEADKIFSKFRDKYSLSESDARRLLSKWHNKEDINELMQLLQTETDESIYAGLLAEVESSAYQARLERLRQLQNQLDTTMQNVYKQEKNFTTSFYTDLANESYYKSMFDIQQRVGLGFSFSHISDKQINKILSMNWSGTHYSERIWSNTKSLAETLKTELAVNLLTGRTHRETAELISNKFAVGASKARRLVRTESNFVSGEMNYEAYKEAGIEEYQFLATLDLRTSEICASLDGQIFKVSEREVGVNYPPMHPWCRSTTISVVDRKYISKMLRSARDNTGKTMYVPRDMNYRQWYDKYVNEDD